MAKVFVVTTHTEYDGDTPETYVIGVYDTLEKAQAVMDSAYGKQLDLNWDDVDEGDIDYHESYKSRSAYDVCDGNYVNVEIWEREVE